MRQALAFSFLDMLEWDTLSAGGQNQKAVEVRLSIKRPHCTCRTFSLKEVHITIYKTREQ